MNKESYLIRTITPLFSYGAQKDSPEIRATSIRGQLHWWHRALGYSFNDECEIYGSIQNIVQSSKIVIRISDVKKDDISKKSTLPHKDQNRAPKNAYGPKTTFTLHTQERLTGLNPTLRDIFNKTVKAWLLMGSLGLRTTRGAGSIYSDQAPQNETEYLSECQKLLPAQGLIIDFLTSGFNSAEDARRIISDTLAPLAFNKNGTLGSIQPRKTSPLRFKVIPFNNIYKILAIWDNRTEVTNNTKKHLKFAINTLADRGKQIGVLLKQSTLYPQ